MRSCEQFAQSCVTSCPIRYPELVRERQATALEGGLAAIGLMKIALHFYPLPERDAATDSLFRSLALYRAALADAKNHTVTKAMEVLGHAFPALPPQAWEILEEGGLEQELEESIQYHTVGAIPVACNGQVEVAPEVNGPVVLCGAALPAATSVPA